MKIRIETVKAEEEGKWMFQVRIADGERKGEVRMVSKLRWVTRQAAGAAALTHFKFGKGAGRVAATRKNGHKVEYDAYIKRAEPYVQKRS